MTKKVLIIEDNVDILEILRELMSAEGYMVFEAFTGEEGMKIVKTIQMDLVLVDCKLPYKSGRNVIEFMRKDPALKSIPVIIISALDEYSNDSPDKSGYQAWINKPFDIHNVLQTVTMVMQK